jgi:hypothetical protein
MKDLYEVQTFTLCDGWTNTWTISGLEMDVNKKFKTVPMTFECYEEAQQAIELHLEEMEEYGMDEDRDDFRVVKLNKEGTK